MKMFTTSLNSPPSNEKKNETSPPLKKEKKKITQTNKEVERDSLEGRYL